MTKNDASVKDRIKKLLRLVESPNANESAVAAERAQELMQKHGISSDDVSDNVITVVDERSDAIRRELAVVIGRYHEVAPRSNGKQIAFKGSPNAVKAAASDYRTLCGEADKFAWMTSPQGAPPEALDVWRIAFWLGFVQAIFERMRPPSRQSGPATPAGGQTPTFVTENAPTIMNLAESLSNAVDDVRSVLDRLWQRATEAGGECGNRVQFSPRGKTMLMLGS